MPFKYLFLYLVLIACNVLAWYIIKLFLQYKHENRYCLYNFITKQFHNTFHIKKYHI